MNDSLPQHRAERLPIEATGDRAPEGAATPPSCPRASVPPGLNTILRALAPSWLILLLFAVTTLLALAGCRTESVETEVAGGKPPYQRFAFDEVKERAKELRPGMSKTGVLLLLGSPARREADSWIYLPSRPGTLLPAEALEVEFRGDRYETHTFQPVIAGERIITD
jgi:outer membrane protein assembly factor BamE (lipoprotein component of BamABCDE complex)